MEIHRSEYEPNMTPEIGPVTEQPRQNERLPDVTPRLEEIVPEKTPTKKQPWEIDGIIGQMDNEEKKEKERQKKIEEIIQKRDNPKRIH